MCVLRAERRSGGDCFSAERTGAWVWQEADIHGKSGGAGGEESRSEAGWRRLAAASAWDPATWETAAKAATDRGDGDRPGSIRVISYNVWFERHRQEERHSALFELMAGAGPDLICIQEATRIFVEQLLAQPFARGYVASGGPDGRSVYPYGVFILARPYLQPRFWKHTLPTGMDRSLLVCDISIAGETASIGTVHLESLSHRQLREDQMDIIFPALAKSPHSMLVGDFNFSGELPLCRALAADTSRWNHALQMAGQRTHASTATTWMVGLNAIQGSQVTPCQQTCGSQRGGQITCSAAARQACCALLPSPSLETPRFLARPVGSVQASGGCVRRRTTSACAPTSPLHLPSPRWPLQGQQQPSRWDRERPPRVRVV